MSRCTSGTARGYVHEDYFCEGGEINLSTSPHHGDILIHFTLKRLIKQERPTIQIHDLINLNTTGIVSDLYASRVFPFQGLDDSLMA